MGPFLKFDMRHGGKVRAVGGSLKMRDLLLG